MGLRVKVNHKGSFSAGSQYSRQVGYCCGFADSAFLI
jgi:hypothetical protein